MLQVLQQTANLFDTVAENSDPLTTDLSHKEL